MNNEKIIVRMRFGSHLYGTAIESSDMDFKSVFLPTKEQVFLGKIPKSYSSSKKKAEGEKNTSDDIDTEIYSLHYFIKLACDGQTVALDMLHAPDEMIIEKLDIWDSIVANREKFYTKNLKAFVSYARKQAARYGLRGGRINAATQVINVLKKYCPEEKMAIIWNKLPIIEYCYMIENGPNDIPQYQVCGKIFQSTAKIGYITDILEKFLNVYGERARLAAENKGIDFKAVSHALRAAYQVKELLTKNTITFPLKEAAFLREVKQGKLDYLKEVAPKLEALMDEVEILSENSALPEKSDRKFWDRFIIDVVEMNVCKSSQEK